MRIATFSVVVAALGLASAASAAATYSLSGGNLSYTEDFEGWAVADLAAPNGTAAYHYWNSTGEYVYANDWWSNVGGSGYRLWNPTRGNWSDQTASLKLADLKNVSGLENSNIEDGLSNIMLKTDVEFSFARQPWIDPNWMATRLWLLNDDGNGYVGLVTADGRLSLFTANNGVASATSLATGGSLDLVATDAMQHLSFSAINGVVTLTMDNGISVVASASTNNMITTVFTKIGIEGYYVDEQYNIDNVVVTGTVVPEAASLSFLGLGGLCLLRRSRR